MSTCKYCGNETTGYRGQCGRCGFVISRLKDYNKAHPYIDLEAFQKYLVDVGMHNLPPVAVLLQIIEEKANENVKYAKLAMV